jgi:hypothetical protein
MLDVELYILACEYKEEFISLTPRDIIDDFLDLN